MSLKATCLCALSRMHMQQSPPASASSLSTPEGTATQRPLFIMRSFVLLLFTLLLVSHGSSAVITGSQNCHSASHPDTQSAPILRCFVEACERDSQCGGGMCCAVSLWIRSLRMCTPMGQEEDDCHPLSHKVPFNGKRLHHTCPCLPNLTCVTIEDGRSKCLSQYKYPDYFL